ncbi:23S rRNA (guanosine(2251)-2'-O)-methyltransferase RlmB [Candidatus Nitrosacidococcus tergens]|uniref:23S rRNA (Guanosine-2'-O-)-methyltransferase RlmB n=1 Tax=Candidatus Nitrosacidococcus tergens TaxID=553981 RepID=A0A7G1Q7M7_9GAMM|nr:23S rRNA (guanosine(2251)-2'-O)-methyltransferase RlmB [Candidatus Nitrosacidococcus tergens]CAB1274409.1 23S rRNA (guanosine-2'-O-)-methyltransferase RlmB [Candidatus Nitrosacidococcus tergens]
MSKKYKNRHRENSRQESFSYGLHSVCSVLTEESIKIISLWINQNREDQQVEKIKILAHARGITPFFVSQKDLDTLSLGANHQGVVIQFLTQLPATEDQLLTLLKDLTDPPFLLILDSIQDPHNLGACLRTAEAAGVHGVIAPKDQAAPITPTVRKVASGAAERVPFITVTNLTKTIDKLKDQGVWIVGAVVSEATSLYQMKLKGSIAVVLGAEGKGLRRLVQAHCDYLISIPMCGAIGSLNVSVATGVFLFEIQRQRGYLN